MDNLLDSINNYYTEKIKKHGSNFSGVDWNSEEGQYLRFKQLAKLINTDIDFTLLDFGCGYGELIHFLKAEFNHIEFEYYGYDISDLMLNHAKEKFGTIKNVEFSNTLSPLECDYAIASGIFNVKPTPITTKKWTDYILKILGELNSHSKLGFSFNMLTSYSDKNLMKKNLYYADSTFFFDYCKKHFSKNIALLHDYDLYEFTIIVRK